MSTMNYYVVLGIAEDADVDTNPERLSSAGTTLSPGRRAGFIHG